jgi:hypothetical protein
MDELNVMKDFGLASVVMNGDGTRTWSVTDKLSADLKTASRGECVDLRKPRKRSRLARKNDEGYCRVFARALLLKYGYSMKLIGLFSKMVEDGLMVRMFPAYGEATYDLTPRAFFCGVEDKNIHKRKRAIIIDLERRGLMRRSWVGEWWPTPEGLSKGLGASDGPVSDLLRDLEFDLHESSSMTAAN